MSFSSGGYVELFIKQCDHWLIYLPSILYSLISWENIRFISLNPRKALPSSICWFVSFVTNNFAGYMKKAPGHVHVTQFMKSFIPIRFPNFASLVVDDVTKKCVFPLLSSFFNPCPHLTIFFIQNSINNHCTLHAIHPCLGRPSPGNVRYFAREIHFDQK